MHTIAAIIFLLFVAGTTSARFIQERAISDDSPALNTLDSVCATQMPCGWEVYGGLRKHVYYLRNECQCPPNTRCVRVEDDILQEAYIYKCRRVAFNNFY